MKLWQKIENEHIDIVYSDFWKPYKEIIPAEKLHQSKAETFTIEGFNSLIRHYLARFRRKTKCYTKSLEMMILSLKLLMANLIYTNLLMLIFLASNQQKSNLHNKVTFFIN